MYHPWAEDITDVVSLGFLVQVDPVNHPKDYVEDKIKTKTLMRLTASSLSLAVFASRWYPSVSVVVGGWLRLMAFWAVRKCVLNSGHVLVAASFSFQVRMSLVKMVARVMTISPMLISCSGVSVAPEASAI
jgi:hypothetical protein